MRLELENDLPTDVIVNMDENKFAQVMTNLMGNALKFTPRGGSVTVSATLASKGFLQLSVADTGVGISKVRAF